MISKEMVLDTLKKEMPNVDFDYEHDEEEDIYSAHHVTLKGLDDDILLAICVSDIHLMLVTFTFDKLPPTDEAVMALADFNTEENYLCAYVDDDGFLTFRYCAFASTEHDVTDTISFLIRYFANISDRIKPLADMTE